MTRDELEALCVELLTDAAVEEGTAERIQKERMRGPAVDYARELEAWREAAERTHGRARAERAHWTILGQFAARLYNIASARKRDALSRALDALEEARRYEEAERRWTRLAAMCARRVSRAEPAAVLEESGALFATDEEEIAF